jgi:hypothetical protein
MSPSPTLTCAEEYSTVKLVLQNTSVKNRNPEKPSMIITLDLLRRVAA